MHPEIKECIEKVGFGCFLQIKKGTIPLFKSLETATLFAQLLSYATWMEEIDFFPITREELMWHTGLTSHKQRNAIATLKEFHLVESVQTGMPAHFQYKINFKCLSVILDILNSYKIQTLYQNPTILEKAERVIKNAKGNADLLREKVEGIDLLDYSLMNKQLKKIAKQSNKSHNKKRKKYTKRGKPSGQKFEHQEVKALDDIPIYNNINTNNKNSSKEELETSGKVSKNNITKSCIKTRKFLKKSKTKKYEISPPENLSPPPQPEICDVQKKSRENAYKRIGEVNDPESMAVAEGYIQYWIDQGLPKLRGTPAKNKTYTKVITKIHRMIKGTAFKDTVDGRYDEYEGVCLDFDDWVKAVDNWVKVVRDVNYMPVDKKAVKGLNIEKFIYDDYHGFSNFIMCVTDSMTMKKKTKTVICSSPEMLEMLADKFDKSLNDVEVNSLSTLINRMETWYKSKVFSAIPERENNRKVDNIYKSFGKGVLNNPVFAKSDNCFNECVEFFDKRKIVTEPIKPSIMYG